MSPTNVVFFLNVSAEPPTFTRLFRPPEIYTPNSATLE